jgi:hypothetical protein
MAGAHQSDHLDPAFVELVLESGEGTQFGCTHLILCQFRVFIENIGEKYGREVCRV